MGTNSTTSIIQPPKARQKKSQHGLKTGTKKEDFKMKEKNLRQTP